MSYTEGTNYLTELAGEYKLLWVEISPGVIAKGSNPEYYEGIVRNIDERVKSDEKIKYLSWHDHLTGLYNRYYFEEELKRLDSPRLYPIIVVIIDINGFKLVNDTFGHKKGDEILKNTAKILKTCFRGEDIVARYGGDEFIVLLPSTTKTTAAKIISRVEKAFNNQFYKKYITSLSIGIAIKKSEKHGVPGVDFDEIEQMVSRVMAEANKKTQKILEELNITEKSHGFQ